jgi:hypothetical protein
MKKKILSIMTIIALLTAMLFGLTACGNKNDEEESKSGPESVVEDYFEYIGKLNFEKAFKLIDWTAYSMVQNEDYDYDEIEDKYDEYAEENEDDLDGLQDSVDYISAYYEEALEDYEVFSIKVKKVEDAEKVDGTKNTYSVKIKVALKISEEDDEDYDVDKTETYEVYVMKSGSDYKIIGGIDDFMGEL